MSVKRTKHEAVFRLEMDRDYLYKSDNRESAWPYDMVIEMLEDPDYVKVVRCKDCDRAREIDTGYICTNVGAGARVASDGKGYCSNGRER